MAAAPSTASSPGLTPEQVETIATARRRLAPVRRASVVAWSSGATLAFFALMSLLAGIFDLLTFGLGVALAVIAAVELRGARRLTALDANAPKLLAANQIALGLLVVAYAAWRVYGAIYGPGAYDEQLVAGGPLADSLEPIDRLVRSVTAIIYLAVGLGSMLAQGLTALYYATRRRHILAFVGETPGWVVQTLRAAA